MPHKGTLTYNMFSWNSNVCFLLRVHPGPKTSHKTAHILMRLGLIKSGLLRWGWLQSTLEHCILCGTLRSKSSQLEAHRYNTCIKTPLRCGSISSGVASVAMLPGWNGVMIWRWYDHWLDVTWLDWACTSNREMRGHWREGRRDEWWREQMGRDWMPKVGSAGRLKSNGVNKWDKRSLGGQGKREGGDGVGWESEKQRERDVWRRRKSTYPDPVPYWGHGKLGPVIPVEPTNTT